MALHVLAGQDRFGEPHNLGISSVAFKVCPSDFDGLFVAEATLRAKGGPARHVHHGQDEWFYVAEGEFVLEIGQERLRLRAGDSAVGPRDVPHAWAHVGDGVGRLVFVFTPPGKMEAFFREAGKTNAMPSQDPSLWRAHGMDVVGPPLAVG
jgi:quercetin dioxygenase-like cupin family protein